MWRHARTWVAATAVVVAAGPAGAARLVEIDRQEQRSMSPETASLDPCAASGSGFGTVNVDGHMALIEQRLGVALRGSAPSCNLAATVDFTVVVAFAIDADPGETAGDPVTLCAQARGTVSASGEGSYSGRSQQGAVTIANPAFVKVNAANVVTLGAFDTTAGVERGQTKQTVAAAVGDTVTMELHNIVHADGTGVGSAHADGDARLAAYVGACPTAPAPTAAPAGLAALLAALAAGGAWSLRRRAAR